ncbi:MAG: metallophosphoesterase family protein [Polyangiaceae bacterium]|nr:metallophosphoesterase family protein [Polyangiaceae bacterium]MCB9606652.1 metallophosphoesterase family protein [Polyangiaceae bacterium]
MRVGVIADVHANLAALDAVLAALRTQDVSEVICLGDIVGYNAQPRECVDRVASACSATVFGNHDHDIQNPATTMGTRAVARMVQTWTRERLDSSQLDWLASLPNHLIHEQGFIAVHGCYLNDHHYSGYVTSTMMPANLERIAAREDWPNIGLVGHTHTAVAAWLYAGQVIERADAVCEWPAQAKAVLLNPGSVGQPRDGDWRASFGVLEVDRNRFEIHRTEYDLESTIAAINAAGLPAELGERLKEGQ